MAKTLTIPHMTHRLQIGPAWLWAPLEDLPTVLERRSAQCILSPTPKAMQRSRDTMKKHALAQIRPQMPTLRRMVVKRKPLAAPLPGAALTRIRTGHPCLPKGRLQRKRPLHRILEHHDISGSSPYYHHITQPELTHHRIRSFICASNLYTHTRSLSLPLHLLCHHFPEYNTLPFLIGISVEHQLYRRDTKQNIR